MLTVEPLDDPGVLLDFAAKVYQDDPAWVPPLDAWLRRRLSPSNPFFREAELRLFAARPDGEVVGTISALRDRRHEAHRGEAVAFFGFFECEDDPGTAAALLDRAADEARRWGLPLLRGPRNLTRVEEVGVTVEGHDLPPPMLASHHPRYYQRLLEGVGFTKHHDVLAWHISLNHPDGAAKPIPDRLREAASKVDLPNLELREARTWGLTRDLVDAHTVFVEAFRDVPENTPMPREQFVNLGRAFLLLGDKRLLQLATVDGEAAGFALCFPELNEAIREARGHLLPLGWARALAGLRGIRTASFKLIGVLPKWRRSGLHARLIERVVEGVRAAGYTRIEGSLIDERNAAMCRVVEGAGMEVYRRYRIYDRGV